MFINIVANKIQNFKIVPLKMLMFVKIFLNGAIFILTSFFYNRWSGLALGLLTRFAPDINE